MSTARPPRVGFLTERELLATYPDTLSIKAVKRGMLAGWFPQHEPLPGGGRGWRADAVQRAMQSRNEPAGPGTCMPPRHVGLVALTGVPSVRRVECRRNEKAGRGPMRPLQARAGLLPMTEAELRGAIRRGEFPEPLRGPFGEAWPLEAVDQWRKRYAPPK